MEPTEKLRASVVGVPYGTPEYLATLIEWSDKGKEPVAAYAAWTECEYSRRDVYHRVAPQNSDPTLSPFDSLTTTGPSRVFGLTHAAEASLFSGGVKFQHRPDYGSYNADQIRALDAISNADWLDDPRQEAQLRLAIRDAYRYGTGAVATFVYGAEPVYSRAKARKLAEIDPVLGAVASAVSADAAIKAAQGEPEPLTTAFDGGVSESVRTEHVPFVHLILDPHMDHWTRARFIGRRMKVDPSSIQRLKGYRHTKDLEVDSATGLTKLAELLLRRSAESWDRFLFSEDTREVVYKDEVPISGYGILQWTDDGLGAYGPSDISQVHDLILAEKLLMTKLVQAAARSGANINHYDKNYMTDVDLAKAIYHPNTGTWIGHDAGPTGRVGDVISRIPSDPVSSEVIPILASLERAYQSTTGVGPNQMGQALKSETSATEASTIAASSEARMAHKVAAVDAWISQIGRDRLTWIAHVYTDEDIARLVPGDMVQLWTSMRLSLRAYLSGMGLSVVPGTVRRPSDDLLVQRGLTVWQLLLRDPVTMAAMDISDILGPILHGLGVRWEDALMVPPEQLSQMRAAFITAQMSGGAPGGPPGGGGPGAANGPGQATQGPQGGGV